MTSTSNERTLDRQEAVSSKDVPLRAILNHALEKRLHTVQTAAIPLGLSLDAMSKLTVGMAHARLRAAHLTGALTPKMGQAIAERLSEGLDIQGQLLRREAEIAKHAQRLRREAEAAKHAEQRRREAKLRSRPRF